MYDKTYVAIDLKSFYASAECVDRGLDPLKTNLVVADETRTEKTICLAVSPSLKAMGTGGRDRLFEIIQKVDEINRARKKKAPGERFSGESYNAAELEADPSLKVSYITAPPRMARYIEVSRRVHEVYLKYAAPEDMHVYSIDEVFIDVSAYLGTYRLSAHDLAMKMILDVLKTTGITATAGIGPNLYLCKIAMDIIAKHVPADENGVRIAELDEISYRHLLWNHRPITDFWRVGRGYAAALARHGIYTMGDVALTASAPAGEDLLYKLFGVNAELLIDHAWGYEPCTMTQIKAYRPESSSISSGQVLKEPYTAQDARLLVKEMAEQLSLELTDKGLVTKQIVFTAGYDRVNLTDEGIADEYEGEVKTDRYGRKVPKHAHGSVNLEQYTSSTRLIMNAAVQVYDRAVNPVLFIRRLNLTANGVIREEDVPKEQEFKQLSFFDAADDRAKKEEDEALEKERKAQKAALDIKRRFGKNAVLKGMNLEKGGTAIERNGQIGGHRSGQP